MGSIEVLRSTPRHLRPLLYPASRPPERLLLVRLLIRECAGQETSACRRSEAFAMLEAPPEILASFWRRHLKAVPFRLWVSDRYQLAQRVSTAGVADFQGSTDLARSKATAALWVRSYQVS